MLRRPQSAFRDAASALKCGNYAQPRCAFQTMTGVIIANATIAAQEGAEMSATRSSRNEDEGRQPAGGQRGAVLQPASPSPTPTTSQSRQAEASSCGLAKRRGLPERGQRQAKAAGRRGRSSRRPRREGRNVEGEKRDQRCSWIHSRRQPVQ